MAKYKVIGLPNRSSEGTTKRTLAPVKREDANLEAEKGEIAYTKLNDNSNIFEMYKIAGKKHSKGGTPLKLPAGSESSPDGSSFIFSDKLKMEDPEILSQFGVDSKKPMTFAEVMTKVTGVVNDAKAVMIDKNSSKMSVNTAKLNLSNAALSIAKAALIQESMKGFQSGYSKIFQPFFDKTGVSPEEVFQMKPEEEKAVSETMRMAYGGPTNDYKSFSEIDPGTISEYSLGGNLQKFSGVDEPSDVTVKTTERTYKASDLPKDTKFKKEGETRYRVGDYIKYPDGSIKRVSKVGAAATILDSQTYNGPVSEWAKQSQENSDSRDKANAIIEAGINNKTIIHNKKTGKIVITGKFSPSFRDLTILSNVINQSGKSFGTDIYSIEKQSVTDGYSKSNKGVYKRTGSFVGGFTPMHYEKRYQLEQLRAKGLTDDEAFTELDEMYKTQEGSKKARTEYLGFLGKDIPPGTDIMSDSYYKDRFSDITKRVEDKLIAAGKYRPTHEDDGLSGFEHFDAFAFASNPEFDIEKNANPATEQELRNNSKTTISELDTRGTAPNPYGMRDVDMMGLSRAIQAKNEIQRPEYWAKSADAVMPDVAFHSPERTIAAINQNVASGNNSAAAFSNAAGAASNSQALNAQAFSSIADAIGSYSDKNVGIFNADASYRANLATQRNDMNAKDQTDAWATNQSMDAKFRAAQGAAKDKINQFRVSSLQHAKQDYNLNSMTENFKKDPNTGLIYKANDKDIYAKSPKEDFSEGFAKFKEGFSADTDEATLVKAYVQLHNGKMTFEDNESLSDAELKTLNGAN